ncbi:MAG TPA: hypothetical protein DCW68_05675 [Rhodospirillaceae bacterium]|nr:MAG: hypothetical protein A2018_01980 [Alphaproteobacteria bacterium GWF2_58_20]HAU29583.1 hypothetical protein [Rhodospirillaceae bacterium]
MLNKHIFVFAKFIRTRVDERGRSFDAVFVENVWLFFCSERDAVFIEKVSIFGDINDIIILHASKDASDGISFKG